MLSVSFTSPFPLAPALLIPVTAARLQVNVVPVSVLVGVYAKVVPVVMVAAKLLVNAGIDLGAATPLPEGLLHPFTV